MTGDNSALRRRALAALIIPADLLSQIESLASTGSGVPSVQIVLNGSNPIERAFVEQTLQAKVDEVEQAISKRVLAVATAPDAQTPAIG